MSVANTDVDAVLTLWPPSDCEIVIAYAIRVYALTPHSFVCLGRRGEGGMMLCSLTNVHFQ